MPFDVASRARAARTRAPSRATEGRGLSWLVLSLAASALAIAACSSTESNDLDAGGTKRPRTLVYANGCTPDGCGEPPSGREPTRCWKGETGACAWSRPVVTVATPEPPPCDAGACGPDPAPIACAAGYLAMAAACSRLDDPACGWRHVCQAAPTDELCDPVVCGSYKTFALSCPTPDGGGDGGEALADVVCRKTGVGECRWQDVCPDGSLVGVGRR